MKKPIILGDPMLSEKILHRKLLDEAIEEEINDWSTIAPKYRTKKVLKDRFIKMLTSFKLKK